MTRPAVIVPRAGPSAAGRCPAAVAMHACCAMVCLVSGGVNNLPRRFGALELSAHEFGNNDSLRGAPTSRRGMTTWWRPDLERIRAEIAAEAELELEVKVEASDGDGANKGVKRKRAPRTKGPCEHGVKHRSKCKVCGACPHGRRRSQCKECGGSQICEHGRERHRCKECGGSGICEHGRRRHECKECGGASVCEHGRRRL